MDKSILQEKQVLLSWSLLLLVVLLLLFFVILPTMSYSKSLDEKIDAGYQRLSRYLQVAEATPEYMEEFKRVQSKGLDKLFYPEGMTAAQVAKELQKQLSTIVTRNEGVLVRSEVLDQQIDESSEDQSSIYQQVTVRADLQGDSRLLRSLFHQSYQARPLIFVESLEIKPMEGKSKSDKRQRVKAEVVISTYWRGGSYEKMD